MAGLPLGLSRLVRLRLTGTGLPAVSAAADGKTYTSGTGLKPGSTAILYANGSQVATTTVSGAGIAIWTLSSAVASGATMTYDGVINGSAGLAPILGPIVAWTPALLSAASLPYALTLVGGTLKNATGTAMTAGSVAPALVTSGPRTQPAMDFGVSGSSMSLAGPNVAPGYWIIADFDSYSVNAAAAVAHKMADYGQLWNGNTTGTGSRPAIFLKNKDFGGRAFVTAGSDAPVGTTPFPIDSPIALLARFNADGTGFLDVNGERSSLYTCGTAGISGGIVLGAPTSQDYEGMRSQLRRFYVFTGSEADALRFQGWLAWTGGYQRQLHPSHPYRYGLPLADGTALAALAKPGLNRRRSAYVGYASPTPVSTWASAMGRSVPTTAVDHGDFSSWANMLSSGQNLINVWSNAGFTDVLITIPLTVTGVSLSASAGGSGDSETTQLVQAYKTKFPNGRRAYRLGHEPNVGRFPWCPAYSGAGTASDFLSAWARKVGVIRAADPQAVIIWNPSTGACDFPWTSLIPPSNQFDVVGVDAYNEPSSPDYANMTGWQRFMTAVLNRDLFGLDQLISLAESLGKPWGLYEYGTGFGGTSAATGTPQKQGGDDPTYPGFMAAIMRGGTGLIRGFGEQPCVDDSVYEITDPDYSDRVSYSMPPQTSAPTDPRDQKPNAAAAFKLALADAGLSIFGIGGTANVGDSTAFTPTIVNGTAPFTVTATGLPPGRSITDPATGLTTGSYTTAGSFNPTYTVTDSSSPQQSANFTRSVTVGAPSAGLQMTQLPPWRIFQRSTMTGGAANLGTGSIPVQITLTASASTIEYRLRDADATSTTVKDWTLAGSNVPANATSVTCSGVPSKKQRYLLDLRANGDNSQIVLGTSMVMMGRGVGFSGQSQAVRQATKIPSYSGTNASLNVAISPFCAVFATYSDVSASGGSTATWAPPADNSNYSSTFAAEFLRLQVEASGVPCALVGHAVGDTAIATWAPGQPNNVQLRTILDAVGGFEAFYWHQGGNDAGANTSKATYKSALDGLFADITAHNAVRGSNYTKLLTAMATRLSGGAGTFASVAAIRQAHQEWCAANSGVYLEPHDINLEDNVHQGQPGNIVLAQHVHRATRPSLGLTGGDDGPTLGTPTRAANSAVVYVPVTLPTGATTLVLTGAAATRLGVFVSGQTSNPLAISSLAYESANTRLAITLSAAPANNVALDIYAFPHPDPSGTTAYADMIRSDRVDGDGITVGRSLTPTTSGPVIAAAPVATTAPAVGDVIWINTYDSRAGGASAASTDSRFNNLDQANYTAPNTLSLNNASGGGTGLRASVTTGMTSGNSQSTTEGASVVPKSVADSFLFIDKGGTQGVGTSSQGKVSITQLDNTTRWTVEVFAFRNTATSRLQDFSVNGTAQTGKQVGTSGTPSAWTATFTGVAPSSGEIATLFTQNGTENFAYLNAMRLTRTA